MGIWDRVSDAGALLGGLGGLLQGQFRRPGPGRPPAIEREVTVATGNQLVSWPGIPGVRAARQELLFNDDLLLKKGFGTYREMLSDDTVKACLAFKKVLIHGRDWEIAPAGGKDAGEKAKEQAAFVQDVFDDVNINEVLRNVLSALEFGFSLGEILWEVREFQGELRVVLKAVKHRDPEYIRIDVDPHGNIERFRQISGTSWQDIVIPPDKALYYGYQARYSNHYGISDLRAAYRPWWSKKFITQFWNVFLERFGQPLLMMKYPQGASDTLKNNLMEILKALSTRSEILVPEGVVAELLEATRAGTAQYGEAVTHMDVAISRAILVPALLGMGVDVKRGSDSQSRLHLRVLMKVAGDICNDLEYIFSNNIVKPLVQMNFGDQEQYPWFTFRDYGEYEAIEIVDSMINMFNAGLLDADQNDLNYARSILGLPMRQEGDEDEVMRTAPPPVGNPPSNPNQAGAGAGKNNDRANKGAAKKSVTKTTGSAKG